MPAQSVAALLLHQLTRHCCSHTSDTADGASAGVVPGVAAGIAGAIDTCAKTQPFHWQRGDLLLDAQCQRKLQHTQLQKLHDMERACHDGSSRRACWQLTERARVAVQLVGAVLNRLARLLKLCGNGKWTA